MLPQDTFKLQVQILCLACTGNASYTSEHLRVDYEICGEVVMLPAHGAHLMSLRLPLHMGRSSVMSSHKTTPKLKRSALCVTLPASGCRPHQSLITYVARAVCHSLIISPVLQNFHATTQMRISMGTVVSTSDNSINNSSLASHLCHDCAHTQS